MDNIRTKSCGSSSTVSTATLRSLNQLKTKTQWLFISLWLGLRRGSSIRRRRRSEKVFKTLPKLSSKAIRESKSFKLAYWREKSQQSLAKTHHYPLWRKTSSSSSRPLLCWASSLRTTRRMNLNKSLASANSTAATSTQPPLPSTSRKGDAPYSPEWASPHSQSRSASTMWKVPPWGRACCLRTSSCSLTT